MRVKLGNTHSTEEVEVVDCGCRTQKQFEAIVAFHQRKEVAFWCLNPFKVDFPGEKYTCTFLFPFYDAEGQLCMIDVTPTGRIKEVATCAASPGSRDEAREVIAKYGPIR